MYKEKYEALKLEFDHLREAHDALADRIRASEAAGETVLHTKNSVAAGKLTGSSTSQRAGGERTGSWAVSTAPAATEPANGDADLERVYRYIVDRAAKEPEPALLSLLVDRPELMVKIERRMINSSDASTQGRIALLLYEKFFDSAKDAGDVSCEFKRRGWFDAKASNAALIKPLAQITEWGFLTKEYAGYQAVPGMKVNIVEARA